MSIPLLRTIGSLAYGEEWITDRLIELGALPIIVKCMRN
jgi:hypothetical protein